MKINEKWKNIFNVRNENLQQQLTALASMLPTSYVCNLCMSDIITESSYHAAARHHHGSSTNVHLQLTFPRACCHHVGAVTALLSQL